MKKYKLYTNCFVSKGYQKSIILDTQRGLTYNIDNSLANYLLKNKILEFKDFSKEDYVFYINFLKERLLIFELDDIEFNLFPELDTSFKHPSIVNVIEINENDLFRLDNKLINYLLTTTIVFNFNDQWELLVDFDDKIHPKYSDTSVEFYCLRIKYHDYLKYEDFILKSKRISQVIVNNAPFTKREKKVFFEEPLIKHIKLNNPNIPLFTESLMYNTYYNKRLFFNSDNSVHFGDNNSTVFKNLKNLVQIIKNKTKDHSFIWNIDNSKILICQNCEFKNICIDEAFPTKNSENSFYKKNECNYNPYIAKWKEEDGYKTLAECGVISNENGFSIDHEKIAEINKVLWDE